MNEGSCHPCHLFCTADEKMSSGITETERAQPKTEREPRGSMGRVSADWPMVVPTPSERQTIVNDGRFVKKGRSLTRRRKMLP